MAKSPAKASSTTKTATKTTKTLDVEHAKKLRMAPLLMPTDLGQKASKDISAALNIVLADVFALYLKTKNFHWHVSGPHFRDYHLMFDEQAAELLAMIDIIAERVRKVGGTTLRSISHIAKLQDISDNNADFVEPSDMLAELCQDNITFTGRLRMAREVCDEHRDVGSVSVIEPWIDESERRSWFLFETKRKIDSSGH